MNVFISGSLAIKKLDITIMGVLDDIIRKEYDIIIGDAYGADSAVQAYLNYKGYDKVTVYCMGKARYNIRQWKTKVIKPVQGVRYYVNKDIAMSNDCDAGLALWDGKSQGTFANIERLQAQDKYIKIIRR